MSRTAQVKRDARMGEAEARRDAGIRVRSVVRCAIFFIGQQLHCVHLNCVVGIVIINLLKSGASLVIWFYAVLCSAFYGNLHQFTMSSLSMRPF